MVSSLSIIRVEDCLIYSAYSSKIKLAFLKNILLKISKKYLKIYIMNEWHVSPAVVDQDCLKSASFLPIGEVSG